MNISQHTSFDITGESLLSIKGETEEVNLSPSFSYASTTDAAKCFLWENRLSWSSLEEGRKRRRGERASFPVWIWPFFRSIFIRCRTVVQALPALSQAREAWPQCPYTSTVPRGGCFSTLPTPNCPALPKQTDFQPLITSTESDTEEALPATVDPHSQAWLGEGCNGPEEYLFTFRCFKYTNDALDYKIKW